ncbi:MAG: ABC transporter permease, partial [Chloroflexota bacterium]
IVSNRELIKRPGFPSPILPVISVTSSLINYLFALPILFCVLWWDGTQLTTAALALPIIMAIQFFFTLGLAYLVATLNVNFRDTEYILSIFLRLTFFLTGIFFDVTTVVERFFILNFNPMLHLVNAYRRILIFGELPPLSIMAILSLCSIGLVLLGYFTFKRANHRYVEEL